MQGADDEITAALSKGDLEAAPVTDAERALLKFAELLTRHAYRNTPEDVQQVRDAGWSEPQIAEGVYVIAMFAFFNRVADAFGLEDPGYGNMQPPAGMPK
ncbi:MAG: carboxymuconolactone decarboxylase family protein [Pirellulaceae bacterium]|nr:carboxymuconolactone decarboxylase family protein [Pirellulaceae bacterium]